MNASGKDVKLQEVQDRWTTHLVVKVDDRIIWVGMHVFARRGYDG